jgi:hypothetical protein
MPTPREEVLTLVVQLVESRLANLRICVTSRPETDIKTVLEPLTFRSISIHNENGQIEDIENYIRSVVNTDAQLRKWTKETKQMVIDVLIERADGMYVTVNEFVDVSQTQTHDIGSVGYIVNLSIFAPAAQQVSAKR